MTKGVLLLILSNAAFGQDRDRTLAQLQHTGWTAREGAPSPIQPLAQTSDGYLWVGTPSGLFRFDGVQFEHYDVQSRAEGDRQDIFSLLATSDARNNKDGDIVGRKLFSAVRTRRAIAGHVADFAASACPRILFLLFGVRNGTGDSIPR
jgi:ligand-binding sensor domain-containing protein